ncbi:MAG: VOC family protein [Alcanivoracaceae bacterium]|nr:VOC family protein [Alcanivoracaceae bacterium]
MNKVKVKVKGIGGVFFKSKNSEELTQWYHKYLGFDLDEYNCVTFNPKTMPDNGYTVWSAFKADTDYFEPSKQQFMINLLVDDVEQMLKQVEEGGATIVGEILDEDYGVFGWFLDPEGFKVELWCPK